MQEDKSWSGNVIVDFFDLIHSPEECQNLCKVGLFCYIYHFHFGSESDSGTTNVCLSGTTNVCLKGKLKTENQAYQLLILLTINLSTI